MCRPILGAQSTKIVIGVGEHWHVHVDNLAHIFDFVDSDLTPISLWFASAKVVPRFFAFARSVKHKKGSCLSKLFAFSDRSMAVTTLEDLRHLLERNSDRRNFLYFVASPDETGHSWCPDCRKGNVEIQSGLFSSWPICARSYGIHERNRQFYNHLCWR